MDCICRDLGGDRRLVYAWFSAMHTRMDMVVWDDGMELETLKSACRRVEEEAGRIERMGSCFLKGSEVSKINMAPAGEPVEVSEELFCILDNCRRHCAETEGLFDVTVSQQLPGVPFDSKLRLQEDRRTVMRLKDGVKVNLSGYLKGYALDKAFVIVKESGIRNGLLNFGNSSVLAFGCHPQGDGWMVETVEGKSYSLHDECLTTSGNDTQQRRHIIDPHTGNIKEGKGMVSVITPTAEAGEVQSTVSFIRNNIKTY